MMFHVDLIHFCLKTPSQSPPVREGDQNCLLRLRVPVQGGFLPRGRRSKQFDPFPPGWGLGGCFKAKMYQINVKHHYKWPSVSIQLHHNQCLMKQGDSHWAKHCNFMCWNAIILHYVAAQDIVEGERILITHVKFCLQRYLYAWLHHCMYGHPIHLYTLYWLFIRKIEFSFWRLPIVSN